MKHEAVTGSVIGAAMAVLNELRPGLDERLYERALLLELLARGHSVDQQCPFEVHYRNQVVGILVPDLIVDGLVIVDTKVVTAFNDTHLAQMLGYLAIARLEVGLLLNVRDVHLQTKRVVRGEAESTLVP